MPKQTKTKPSASAPAPINIDADPFNADWPKRTWDLGINNVADLRAYLQRIGVTPEQFKQFPVYVWNVDKPGMEWLHTL